MSLEKKIVTLFLTLGVSLALGGVLMLRLAVLPVFQDFESDFAQASQMRTLQALAKELDELGAHSLSLSQNPQLFDYAASGGADPVPSGLSQSRLRELQVDVVSVYDMAGTRVHHVGRSLPESDQDGTAKDVFAAEPGLVDATDVGRQVTGWMSVNRGIAQVSSAAIRNGDASGSAAGTVVMARFLNDARLEAIGQSASAQIALHPLSTKVISSADVSHHTLENLTGQAIAQIKVKAPRSLSRISSDLTRMVGALLIGLAVLFSVTSSLFVRQLVTEPLKTLNRKILAIRETGDLQFDTDTQTTDEIGLLSQEFATMTRQLSAGRAELEQARDEAVARSCAKSEFIARMSHEIRTPMSGVLGMTELLKHTPLSSKQMRYTNTILDSAKSLLDVINNVLDFSKIEAGKLQIDAVDVDLNSLVEEVVEGHAPLAHAQKTELMSVLPREAGRMVKLDALRLKQVLNNLISNALKFTHEGEVIVRMSTFDVNSGKLPVMFEVSDNGIGIDPEDQATIFESFAQAKGSTARTYGGSGLGLAICKQLVEQMGGELSVSSSPNKGSVFSFNLALELSGTTSKKVQELSAIAGCRVLVVDDNASNRGILEHQLLAWKVNARTESSSEEAYARLVSAMAHGNPYDMVLVDLDMPGMNGLDLIRTIRANPRFELLNILVLSSLAKPAPPELFDDFKVAGELSKPVRQSQLNYAVQAVMKHQPLRLPGKANPDSESRELEGRVLVVEDNEVNAEVARAMLESMGVEVDLAMNGLQGVEKVEAAQYDLILMDCQLPLMSGLEATETIRIQESESGARRVPIIAATANAFEADYEQCMQAGMDDCLSKPFTFDQLFYMLQDYLEPSKPSYSQNGAPAALDLATHSEPGRSVIDETTIRRLSQLQQPGAPNIVRKLLSLYLQSSSVIKDRLGNAIDSSDKLVVRESAHALKSSSLNVGAIELAELCKRLESIGRDGTLSEATDLRESLEQEYTRVVSAVKSELKGSHV